MKVGEALTTIGSRSEAPTSKDQLQTTIFRVNATGNSLPDRSASFLALPYLQLKRFPAKGAFPANFRSKMGIPDKPYQDAQPGISGVN